MRIAIPLLAARLTQDPFLISIIAALALLPWLFFAIPAGILVDRIDRRHALAIAQAVRTALAAPGHRAGADEHAHHLVALSS